MRKYALTWWCMILISFNVSAQSIIPSVINASGNSFSKGNYVIDWSVGEMSLIDAMSSADNSTTITNGFLQPFLFEPKISDNFLFFTPGELKILPNPTYNKIEIDFLTNQSGTVSLVLNDASGKFLLSKKIFISGLGTIERLDLSTYSAGTYFIRLELTPAPGSIRKMGIYKIVKL